MCFDFNLTKCDNQREKSWITVFLFFPTCFLSSSWNLNVREAFQTKKQTLNLMMLIAKFILIQIKKLARFVCFMSTSIIFPSMMDSDLSLLMTRQWWGGKKNAGKNGKSCFFSWWFVVPISEKSRRDREISSSNNGEKVRRSNWLTQKRYQLSSSVSVFRHFFTVITYGSFEF